MLIQKTRLLATCLLALTAASCAPIDPLAAAPPAPVLAIDPVVVNIAVGAGSEDGIVTRVTLPAEGEHLPVIIFSHGNRLSRTDYDPLVRSLARAGFAVVQPDHPDASVDGLMPDGGGGGPDTWKVRVRALKALAENIDRLEQASPLLAGRFDPSKLVALGHSYGGHSVALAMGAKPALPVEDLSVPGFKAAVLLAPPGGFAGTSETWRERLPYLDVDYGTMRGPVLVINGEADDSVMTSEGPGWHDDPFVQAAEGQGICLMKIPEAGHYLGGIDSFLRPPGDASAERREQVFGTIAAFFNAALAGTGTPSGAPYACK